MINVEEELTKILLEEKLLSCPLLIFCNKRDLKNSLSDKEIFEILKLEKLTLNRHYQFIECSGITGEGLLKGIEWLLEEIINL